MTADSRAQRRYLVTGPAALWQPSTLTVGGVFEGEWKLHPPRSPGSTVFYVLDFDPLGENGDMALLDNVSAWSEAPAL